MHVMGIAGWSGSGKTALIVRLIPALTRRGLAVSTIKHAHHQFDVDQPGKDSYEHRAAGAREVLVSSSRRWALMHELRGDPEPSLDDLLGRLNPVDLVLVEGFKRTDVDKIEVWRPATGERPLWTRDERIVTLATSPLPPDPAPPPRVDVFDLDDVDAIATYLVDRVERRSSGP